MNKRKFVWVLLLLAASAILLSGIKIWRQNAYQMEISGDILVSREDSFCAGDLEVEFYTRNGAPVYYTTDGSIPTLESERYVDALFFKASEAVQSVVIRARSYDEPTGTWGALFTRTYFYAENMETIQDRFSTYIVCVTSDPYNLYDYEYGILTEGRVREEYVNSEEYDPELWTKPANFTQTGRDWERESYIEILTADGERVVGQNAGIRVFGTASRQSYHKSLKLFAREEYEKGSFDYPLFPDNVNKDGEIQQSYERLVVRNHGQDRSETLFREELFQTLLSQIDGIDSKCVTPAAVYLNGEYYNFGWLQETYDDLYMKENYGADGSGYYETVAMEHKKEGQELNRSETKAKDDYEQLKKYSSLDLTDDKIFEEFAGQIDLDNMLQYFAIELYIANWDWPQNNIKMYRYYAPGDVYKEGRQDGKWRYLYYDLEAGFNLYNEPEEEWRCIQDALDGNVLFGAVMQRKDMQEKFALYMQKCMDEYFTEERVRSAVRELRKQRDKELAYKLSLDETQSLSMEVIESNIEVIYDFLEKRPKMMKEELEELFGIKIE